MGEVQGDVRLMSTSVAIAVSCAINMADILLTKKGLVSAIIFMDYSDKMAV